METGLQKNDDIHIARKKNTTKENETKEAKNRERNIKQGEMKR